MAAEQRPFSTSPETAHKQKRSLSFIGDFFTWCCSVANENQIHDLIDNEADITEHTNNLIDMVAAEHQDLVMETENLNNFTKNVQSLADKVHDSLKTMQDEIESFTRNGTPVNMQKQLFTLTQQTLIYIYYNYFHDNLRQVKRSCETQNLPEILIPRQNLTLDLIKLNNIAHNKSLTLAINPNSNLDLYYTLPITTCTIIQDYILLKVKIPLKKSSLTYKVFQNIPIPLHWQDKLCYITTTKYTIIKTEKFTQAIDYEDNNCNRHTYPLCLIPRETMNSDPAHRCLQHILTGANLQTLRQICQFTCTPQTPFPIITKILPNKFLITNIQQNLTLNCPQSPTTSSKLAPTQAGTLELLMPCSCTLLQDDATLINSLTPCDANDHAEHKATHLLPISWTKFETMTIFPLELDVRQEFNHLHEVLNANWTLSTPTYFVHNLVRQDTLNHIHLKHTASDIFNNTALLMYIFLAWTTALTLLVLTAFYCIHVNNIKMKMLQPHTPTRDYPLQETTH